MSWISLVFNVRKFVALMKVFVRHLKLSCTVCLYSYTFFISKQINLPKKTKGGQKLYSMNVRAIYGCRQVGTGHEHLKKSCCYLNMPEPMLSKHYQKFSLKLKEFAKRVAEKSMSMATSKLRGAADSSTVGVSVDGIRQPKSFKSLNGAITNISIDSRKALDTAILSKSCNGCTRTQTINEKDPNAYDKWNAAHNCSLNYKGSSPAMGKVGAEKLFKQSVTKQSLHYTSFYDDSDSKAFPAVENAYGLEKPVKKYECIGHYQKRVGAHLPKKKNVKRTW